MNFDSVQCKSDCSPGCVCPPGYVLDQGKGHNECVKEDECMCYYHGKYYNKSDRVLVECNEW